MMMMVVMLVVSGQPRLVSCSVLQHRVWRRVWLLMEGLLRRPQSRPRHLLHQQHHCQQRALVGCDCYSRTLEDCVKLIIVRHDDAMEVVVLSTDTLLLSRHGRNTSCWRMNQTHVWRCERERGIERLREVAESTTVLE